MTLADKNLQYRKTLSDIGRKLTDGDMKSICFISKAVPGLTKRDLELDEPLEFFEKLEERGVLSWDDTAFLSELLSMVHRADCLRLLEQYQRGESLSADGVSGGHREPVQAVGHDGYHSGSWRHREPVQAMDRDDGYDSIGHKGYHSISNGYDSPDSAFIRQETSITVGLAQLPVHRNKGMVQQVRESSMGDDLSDVFDLVVEEIGRDWRQLARKLHLTESEIERISEDHMRNLREQSMQCLVLWKKKMRSQATKAALVEALKKCRMMYIADMLEGCQFR